MALINIANEGKTAVLTLSDPSSRNILSAEMCDELRAAVGYVGSCHDFNALIVTGQDKAFCAGADLADLEAASVGKTSLEPVYRAFLDVAACPLPTVAAVNGAAVGAGMNLALACDMRVAASTAWFDTRFLSLGLHPGGGHGWMLLRAVGWAETSRLLLTAPRVSASEALAIGLVQQSVDERELLAAALKLVAGTATMSRELLVRTKQSLHASVSIAHDAAIALETEEQMRSLRQPAFRDVISKIRRTADLK